MYRRLSLLLIACGLLSAGCTLRLKAGRGEGTEHELRSITLNTGAYTVEPKQIDRRSESIVAAETMHIVAFEHFNGVQRGGWSDNGHILSLSPENPWVKWEKAGTGMEPTGATGYFGYCGRDYYAEVSGIPDVCVYQPLPAGTCIVVPKGVPGGLKGGPGGGGMIQMP